MVEIKDYNVMINGQSFFDQPVKNNLRTYDNIRKIATSQGDDYTIVFYQITMNLINSSNRFS